jgi:hypothetical protein
VPDGIFSNQKPKFGEFLEGLAMEDVVIFHGHLVYFKAILYTLWTFFILYGHFVYFMDIWYTLWTFGILYGHLVYFMDIWYT